MRRLKNNLDPIWISLSLCDVCDKVGSMICVATCDACELLVAMVVGGYCFITSRPVI